MPRYMADREKSNKELYTTTIQREVADRWAVELEVTGYPPSDDIQKLIERLLALVSGATFAVLNYFPPERQKEVLRHLVQEVGTPVHDIVKLAHYKKTHIDKLGEMLTDSSNAKTQEIIDRLLHDIAKEYPQDEDSKPEE